MDIENQEITPFEKTIGLLIEPNRAMEGIAKKPDLLFPFLITLFTAMFTIPIQEYTQDLVGLAAIELPLIFSFFSATFAALLGWVIMAGIYLFITNILGGTSSFRQMLSLTGYLGFITLLDNLIKTIFIAFTGTLVNLGPAIFLDLEQRLYSPLGAFLQRFDLFYLLFLGLFALGLIHIADFSKTKAIGLVVFFWAMGTLFNLLGAVIL